MQALTAEQRLERIRTKHWRELRNDLIAGFFVALAFAGGFLIWINSPTVKAERADQRKQAMDFLRLHQYSMLPDDVQAVMKALNISYEEISPSWWIK